MTDDEAEQVVTYDNDLVKQLMERALQRIEGQVLLKPEEDGCSKLSTEANALMAELLRRFTIEMFQRARAEAELDIDVDEEVKLDVEHVQTILPGILMDF
jgi:hypothetical protein